MTSVACTADACTESSSANSAAEYPLVIGEPGSLLSLLLDEQRRMTPVARAAVGTGEESPGVETPAGRLKAGESPAGEPTAVDVFARLHESSRLNGRHDLPAQSRYYRDLIPAGLPGADEQF